MLTQEQEDCSSGGTADAIDSKSIEVYLCKGSSPFSSTIKDE